MTVWLLCKACGRCCCTCSTTAGVNHVTLPPRYDPCHSCPGRATLTDGGDAATVPVPADEGLFDWKDAAR